MQRYIVDLVVKDANSSCRYAFAVPSRAESLVACLYVMLKDRAVARGILNDFDDFDLHLFSRDGPFLYLNDRIGDMIGDDEKDKIFAVLTGTETDLVEQDCTSQTTVRKTYMGCGLEY